MHTNEVNFEKRGKLDCKNCPVCGVCLCLPWHDNCRSTKFLTLLLTFVFLLLPVAFSASAAEIPMRYRDGGPYSFQDITNKGDLVAQQTGDMKALLLLRKSQTPIVFGCLGPVGNQDDTQPRRFNNRGSIAGTCVNKVRPDPTAEVVGFLRDKQGNLTFIRPPGSVNTEVYGLSDFDDITGQGADPVNPTQSGFDGLYGFLRRSSVGNHPPSFVRIDVPIDNTVSIAGGVNKQMQVLVNWFTVDPVTNETGQWHCALYDNGNFSSLDVLGASWTYCLDINNRGGVLKDSSRGNRIFDDGIDYTIQNPVVPAGYTVSVDANGFNDDFEIVGRYFATQTCPEFPCPRFTVNFIATPN